MRTPTGKSETDGRGGLWRPDFLTEKPGHHHRLVHALGSDVRIDEDAGVVSKRYRPRKLVRLLYWLAFQAPFPYASNRHAIRAAELRRDIADVVLKYEIGPGLVSLPRLHRLSDLTLDSDYVPGREPADRKAARQFLRQASMAFRKAGLPVWQVAPWQPHAITNLIERPDGRYEIIDLESNFVTPYVPLAQVGEMLEQGLWPVFDDINVKRLRRYLQQNEDGLQAMLPGRRMNAFRSDIDEYEAEARAWHSSELRLVPKLSRVSYKVVTWPWALGRAIGRLRQRAGAARESVESELLSQIDRWQAEGRIDAEQAAGAREAAETPDVRLALTHFAVMLAVSVALRFPLGSIARFSWVLAHRVRAEFNWLRRRPEQARLQRRVHAVPVLLLAAVPGIGAFAYALSPPLIHNVLLAQIVADAAGHSLPLQLYERMHLEGVLTLGHRPGRAAEASDPAGRGPQA